MVVRLFSARGLRLGCLAVAGLLALAGFAVWQRSAVQAVHSIGALPPSLPQDPQIQAFFNQSQAAVYTESYRQQERLGDNLEQVIVTAIHSAHTSIDVAAHELNLPQIAIALKAQHQAGVKVRVIVENTYRRPQSEWTVREIQQLDDRALKKYQDFLQFVDQNRNGQLEPAEVATRDAMAILQAAGIPVLDDTADGSKGSDLMHHKFVVIDGQRVVIGSANFTWSDIHGDFSAPESRGNANHLLTIESPQLASLFTQEFNLMWGKGTGTKTSQFGLKKPYRPAQTLKLAPHSQITVQFSPTAQRRPWPQSVNGLIGRHLSRATQTIDVALFVFSEQPLANVLEDEHRQGSQIRALIDPGFAYRDYSEALDLLGVALANNRCRYEEHNRPWQQPITTVGVPQLPKGDLLHHKFGVVDGKVVLTGSQNWSVAANQGNDENLLVIENLTVAAHFQQEFERLYASAVLGLSPQVEAKIERQKSQCRSSPSK